MIKYYANERKMFPWLTTTIVSQEQSTDLLRHLMGVCQVPIIPIIWVDDRTNWSYYKPASWSSKTHPLRKIEMNVRHSNLLLPLHELAHYLDHLNELAEFNEFIRELAKAEPVGYWGVIRKFGLKLDYKELEFLTTTQLVERFQNQINRRKQHGPSHRSYMVQLDRYVSKLAQTPGWEHLLPPKHKKYW